MECWSTDRVAETERFALWREWRAAHLFGLTGELDSDDRRAFRASIASRPVGDAVLVDLRSSSSRASRNSRDIACLRTDSLCIYQQIAGPAWGVEDRRRDPFAVQGQRIAFGYSDLPHATVPVTGEPFRTRLVKIPMTGTLDPWGRRGSSTPRVLGQESGPAALFAAYAQSFFANIAKLDVEAAKVAVDTLGRLALLAYDSALPVEAIDSATTAISSGRLQLVQAFIRANLRQPDLSPETVARKMGMSLRQLHRLFEPTGTTFARYVTAQRTERVAEMLAGAPSGSIIDLAFACGFSATSAFYRAFKAQYGMSPSDYRQKAPHPYGETSPTIRRKSNRLGTQREAHGTLRDAIMSGADKLPLSVIGAP